VGGGSRGWCAQVVHASFALLLLLPSRGIFFFGFPSFFGIEALVSLLIFFQLFVCISRYSTAVEIINIVVALVVCPRS